MITPSFEKTRGQKYIHVNQHRIRDNLKNNTNHPVLTMKHKGRNVYGHTVEIDGPSQLVYSGKYKLLACGARVAIVTHAPVRIATDADHSNWINFR